MLIPFRAALLLSQPPESKISMPLARVHVRQIGDTWQAPRPEQREHEGQDLFAPRDTPVYSATRGLVIRIGAAGLGGNAVSVLGAGGRVYYYAHLSRFGAIRIGDEVTPASILGYVGTTGNAQGLPPHLHFGVYGRNGAINPLPLLVDRPVGSDTGMVTSRSNTTEGKRLP